MNASAMKVTEAMTHGIEGIQDSDTVLNAAIRMKDLDIGSIAVFSGDSIVGMITDRDIAVRVVGNSLNPSHTKVGEVMSKEPVTCKEKDTLQQAAKIMENYKVRRILVKNAAGQISGILTIDDIALRGQEKLVAEVIKQVKVRTGPKR
jgi:CBS domain-containing protein